MGCGGSAGGDKGADVAGLEMEVAALRRQIAELEHAVEERDALVSQMRAEQAASAPAPEPSGVLPSAGDADDGALVLLPAPGDGDQDTDEDTDEGESVADTEDVIADWEELRTELEALAVASADLRMGNPNPSLTLAIKC